MRILHYFLGFPPYRTGGLTRFSLDLMKAQYKNGDAVMALWPGRINPLSRKVKIERKSPVEGINCFELINPLPVSLDEGIRDISAFTAPCKPKAYENFIAELKPDIVHIHTLMGIHKEFFEVLDKQKIKTVFTSHDYFGICPKLSLYRFSKVCLDDENCQNCIQCNLKSLSLGKIFLMQSPMYRALKDSRPVKAMRAKHRDEFFSNDTLPEIPKDADVSALAEGYRKLREYYIGILKSITVIHFNSSLAKEVYCRFFTPQKYSVINISHSAIRDNRAMTKTARSGKLRILYLAPAKAYKGYKLMRTALDMMWNEGNRNFELKIFSHVPDAAEYMTVQKEGYTQAQLPEIFSEADILIAPSAWYETFGFTVQEALSYGVPVIVSDNVGAKDIVGNCGIVVEAGNPYALESALNSLNKAKINELKHNIITEHQVKTFDVFLKEMYSLYQA